MEGNQFIIPAKNLRDFLSEWMQKLSSGHKNKTAGCGKDIISTCLGPLLFILLTHLQEPNRELEFHVKSPPQAHAVNYLVPRKWWYFGEVVEHLGSCGLPEGNGYGGAACDL